MSKEERRTVVVTTGILLLSSLVRLGWEVRPVPPILPPESIPQALVEQTQVEVDRAERMATPLAPGERVDPNRDPDVELARLPGIGPVLAARIVADREVNGAFGDAEALLRVSGIGPATLSRLAPLLDLSDPPSLPAPGAAERAFAGTPQVDAAGLDLNRATSIELQALPGIGPALADRILDHRTRMGPFRREEDLLEVPGIGPAILARLLPLIWVST